jgi:WD40 repeat protein
MVKWHPTEEILVSASYDDTIRIWKDDAHDDWYCVSTLTGHQSTVWAIDFDRDGKNLGAVFINHFIRILKFTCVRTWLQWHVPTVATHLNLLINRL